jgi:Ca2+-binding RTX toxin-like protein
MVVVATVGSAVTLTAGPANAATGVFVSAGDVIVNAGAGVANDIRITLSGNTVNVQDLRATLTAGTGCSPQLNGSVSCQVSLVSGGVVVNAGDLGDNITKNANIRGDLRGGTGDDIISAGPTSSSNILNGGAGRDTLNGGSGSDFFLGGAGPDTFTGGGGLSDVVSYQESGAGVVVDIDNAPDDGVAGEGDNVRTDVEFIYGSEFGDTITGGAANDILSGFGGSDVLDGGAGSDSISGGAGNDTMRGGAGNDTLDGRDNVTGNDTLNGGANTDTCTADSGDAKSFCEA